MAKEENEEFKHELLDVLFRLKEMGTQQDWQNAWVLRSPDVDRPICTTFSMRRKTLWALGNSVVSTAGPEMAFFDSYREVRTSHFKQVPIGKKEKNGLQAMKIVCLDKDDEIEIVNSVGPLFLPKIGREFWVEACAVPANFIGSVN